MLENKIGFVASPKVSQVAVYPASLAVLGESATSEALDTKALQNNVLEKLALLSTDQNNSAVVLAYTLATVLEAYQHTTKTECQKAGVLQEQVSAWVGPDKFSHSDLEELAKMHKGIAARLTTFADSLESVLGNKALLPSGEDAKPGCFDGLDQIAIPDFSARTKQLIGEIYDRVNTTTASIGRFLVYATDLLSYPDVGIKDQELRGLQERHLGLSAELRSLRIHSLCKEGPAGFKTLLTAHGSGS